MRRPESEQGMSSLNLHESQLSSMDALPPRVEVNFYQVQFMTMGWYHLSYSLHLISILMRLSMVLQVQYIDGRYLVR